MSDESHSPRTSEATPQVRAIVAPLKGAVRGALRRLFTSLRALPISRVGLLGSDLD